jgi:hypothetical protein
MKQKEIGRTLGTTASVVLFLAGAAISVTLLVIAIWADLEASVFDTSIKAEKTLRSMSCPMIMTTNEVGQVEASFTNHLERTIKPAVRVHISDGYVTYMREENAKFELAPQETKRLTWTVMPEDAAFGQFILVKVYRFQFNQIPSYQATCGIYVVDFDGLTGGQITWAAVGLGFIGLAGGTASFSMIERPLKKKRKSTASAMIVFSLVLLLGFVFSYLGFWLLSAIALVAMILIMCGSIAQLLK